MPDQERALSRTAAFSVPPDSVASARAARAMLAGTAFSPSSMDSQAATMSQAALSALVARAKVAAAASTAKPVWPVRSRCAPCPVQRAPLNPAAVRLLLCPAPCPLPRLSPACAGRKWWQRRAATVSAKTTPVPSISLRCCPYFRRARCFAGKAGGPATGASAAVHAPVAGMKRASGWQVPWLARRAVTKPEWRQQNCRQRRS